MDTEITDKAGLGISVVSTLGLLLAYVRRGSSVSSLGKRVKAIEESMVTKDEFSALREDIREMRRENREDIRSLSERCDNMIRGSK